MVKSSFCCYNSTYTHTLLLASSCEDHGHFLCLHFPFEDYHMHDLLIQLLCEIR